MLRRAMMAGASVPPPGGTFATFDPALTDLAKITLSDGNKRAVYSAANDWPPSSSGLQGLILGTDDPSDRVFEFQIHAAAGRVYAGGYVGSLVGYDPASNGLSSTGQYLVWLGDGSQLHSGNPWGSSPIAGTVGSFSDVFAVRITTDLVGGQILQTSRFYQNGALRHTGPQTVVGATADSALIMVVGEGGTIGAANSFNVTITTDPALMQHHAIYGGAEGWPA